MSDIQEIQADILVDLQLQLEQESFIVSQETVEIFKKLGIEIQRLPLENTLFHGSPMVRGVAAKLLGRLKDARAVHNISNCRNDEDPWVRSMAYEALGQFPGVQISQLITQGLKDPDWKVRGVATQVIAPYRHEESKDLFVQMLQNDPAEEVKAACARALSFFDDDALIVVLAKSMHSALPRTRAMSIKALGTKSPTKQVAEELLPFLKDPHPWVRSSTAWCLGVWDYFPAVPILKDMITDVDPKVSESSVQALGMIFNQRHINDEHSGSIDALRQSLSNTWCATLQRNNKLTNTFIQTLLNSLSQVRYGLSESQRVIVDQFAIDADNNIRLSAIKCLCNCAAWESRAHLFEILEQATEEPAIRAAILDLLTRQKVYQDDPNSMQEFEKIAEAWLQDENAWLVGGAILAVSSLNFVDLGPAVLSHLNHHNPDVRGRACQVIAKLDAQGAEAALTYTLREDTETMVRYAAAQALIKYAAIEETQDVLMYALNDEDTSVQIACAQTLCKAGFGRTITTLQKVLLGDETALKLATARSLIHFNHPDWVKWIKDHVENEKNPLVKNALIVSMKAIQKGFDEHSEL